MSKTSQRIETKLIHAGEPRPGVDGAVTLPIFQTAAYEFSGERTGEVPRYIRYNNTPNHLALQSKLAALENAEAALVTANGMAAISVALLTVLRSGDHLLAQDCLYGGTLALLAEEFSHFGISFDFIDGNDPASWNAKLRPNTKAIYTEAITNPLMDVADHRAVVAFARKHGLVSLIDNTFASPVNFRPLEIGYDLSLHSGTKYLNGHTDIVAGVCIGPAKLIRKVERRVVHLGGTIDPHAAFLLQRGMKTLALRVRQQNESALRIARFLETHRAVAKVNYPGLSSHPRYRRARTLFDGFGGMLSFELKGGLKAATRLLRKIKLPVVAPSLGGVESLITRPAMTSHRGLTPQARRKLGIADSLVRLSVGIEAAEDLIDDLDQTLR